MDYVRGKTLITLMFSFIARKTSGKQLFFTEGVENEMWFEMNQTFLYTISISSRSAFTCSKLRVETLAQGVK